MLVDLSKVCKSQKSHECMTKKVTLNNGVSKKHRNLPKGLPMAKLGHLEQENKSSSTGL